MTLLVDGVVSEIYLNDADIRIYAFWRAVLHQSERFASRIAEVPLTIQEWRKQQEICAYPRKHPMFDIGFASFYMNRCNRSGVLIGSGPIGGYEQQGPWRMDVRFNRETLAERVLRLSKYRQRINVFSGDAIEFLKKSLPKGEKRRRVFVYLDPPYVNKGQRLYLNFYEKDDHKKLAQYLYMQKALHWIMSYDDSTLVRDLYQRYKIALLPIRYTLQAKRSVHELIIAPRDVAVPFACRMGQNETALQKVL